ncbi:hypothetical protein LJ707_03225 [Mucilaginibacter sp. UR6-1]|uniref:hypothetical protein n=1 Tax=Mucilaginibacter sp. UR6-1 TaxID=1435643 RepID=UPI001E3909AF|nr:hypothetical protein [Mucilaginibacter sp. UR6-1]MCC8407925.1 hypothetical protein [Mucilaginibacter sp. UR6-1]
MRKIIIIKLLLLAFFVSVCDNLRAQTSVAVSGGNGIYVYCGTTLPKKGSYIIKRADAGKNNWQTVGSTRFPADSNLFFANYDLAMSQNPAAVPLEAAKRPIIWRMLQKQAITDSLNYYASQPAFLQAAGTVYNDTSAVIGKTYDYKISFTADTKAEQLVRAITRGGRVDDYKLQTIYAEPYENKVVIRYYSRYTKVPAMVKLYRQYYMQTEYTEVPAIFNMVTDSNRRFYMITDINVKKDLLYKYYAVPYDAYGNAGQPSDTARLANMVSSNLPAVERLQAISVEKQHAIKLTWKFAPLKFLKSINIYRSESYDTAKYDLIASLQPSDTVFYDKKVLPIKTYYYFMVLNGDRVSSTPSARVPGMLKADRLATAPQRLKVNADGNTAVLSWRRMSADTRGYYLFRSDGDSTHMKQVSGLIPVSGEFYEIYRDTITGKGKRSLYYMVKAENRSYDISAGSNKVFTNISGTSAIINVVSLRVKDVGGHPLLYWPLQQDQQTVYSGYLIHRKKADEPASAYKPIGQQLQSTVNYLEDTSAVKGISYTYYLGLIKTGGQTNRSAEVTYQPFRAKILSPGGIIVQQDGSNANISWDVTGQVDVKQYKIYRLNADGSTALVAEVDKGKGSYTASAGSKPYFTVVCVDGAGNESEIENWVGMPAAAN